MKQLAITLCLLFSATAFADTLTFVNTGGQAVDQVYVYPYNLSVDGAAATTPMMCLDFALHVTSGESWQATESAVPMDDSQASVNLRAAAIISYKIGSETNAQTIADDQFAAWEIFDASVSSQSGFTAAAAAIATDALAAAQSGNLSAYAGLNYAHFTIFTPTGDTTGWTDGPPQVFIDNLAPAPTPEPSSIVLLGTGVLGFAGIKYRGSRRRSKPESEPVVEHCESASLAVAA